MSLRLYYDKYNIIRLASTRPVITNHYKYVEVDGPVANPIGKRVVFHEGQLPGKIKLAVVCNWGDECGISTYTKYLVDALAPMVDTVKIFSEQSAPPYGVAVDNVYDVSYCWSRGEPLHRLVREVLDWQPSVVLIQHEYGIFPRTSYLIQMLQSFNDIPYVVTMHSVYEHLDKTIASSAMHSIVVHTDAGRECLRRLGNRSRIWVIPHGCVISDDTSELWNTWQTPYPIVQFGFGFDYKGVDVALEALSLLRKQHPSKYCEVFYTYFCSENRHVRNVNDQYARSIRAKIEELGLRDNAALIRGYQSEETLNNALRTSRLAMFPYVSNSHSVVYGSSGAIRLAMANGVPVIASASPMFDDMEGTLPRPKDAGQLAETIDGVFSNAGYRQGILDRTAYYIRENSWEATAARYLSVLQAVRDNRDEDVVLV